MNRKFLLAGLGVLAFAAGTLSGQAPAPRLEFEVASIKPAPPLDPQKIMAGQMHIGMTVDAGRVDIGFFSLSDLIQQAYKVKNYQVTGPEWLTAQRFDIMATLPAGATKEQVPEMLQSLLADRFRLTIHHDSKEHSVYALVVGKNGAKMKESEPDPVKPADAAPAEPPKGAMVFGRGENQVSVKPNSDGKGMTMSNSQMGQMRMTMGEGGNMRMEFGKLAMPMLCDMLTRFVDRPVVDKTELKGTYQVGLDLSMDDMKAIARASGMGGMMGMMGGGGGGNAAGGPADAASSPMGTSIFNAVQQLGLKLEPRKLPVDTIVIDHAEKNPTEN